MLKAAIVKRKDGFDVIFTRKDEDGRERVVDIYSVDDVDVYGTVDEFERKICMDMREEEMFPWKVKVQELELEKSRKKTERVVVI